MNEILSHPRYRAGAVLGRGAQGVVLRVEDREAPARPLVAKLYTARGFDPALLAGEFALLARLRIPGLVRAHDLAHDQASGAPFLVEDFVDGPEAAQWLNQGPQGPERVKRLAGMIALAGTTLAALHDAGFVHGDLKPAHLRIDPDGRPMLLDLGAAVARASSETAVGITPGYAAPEIVAGAAPSPASDLFGFGATLWAVMTGAPPPPASRQGPSLRRQASWIPPSLCTLLERMIAEHPSDRPRDAREVLSELGQSFPSAGVVSRESGSSGLLVGRQRELASVLAARAPVLYLSGAAGIGKSHLLREAVTERLLAGRPARLVGFPCDDTGLVQRLIAFFSGAPDAWPFGSWSGSGTSFVLALDDLERAPEDLRSALEAYRCRVTGSGRLVIVAAVRDAPPGAEALLLGPLDAQAARQLAEPLCKPEELAPVLDLARGNPGVIAAAVGRVALNADAAREHVRGLSREARAVLGAIAIAGGELGRATCTAVAGARAPAVLAELQSAGLLVRRTRQDARSLTPTCALPALGLAQDLAAALGTFDVADALADCLLATPSTASELLLRVAGAPNPPAKRRELLVRAVEHARNEGLRTTHAEALLSLAADPRERTADLLVELDRVTRGGGSSGLHPELLRWLEAAMDSAPELATLALRRRAEEQARAGDYDRALGLVEQARAHAVARRDPWAEGLALAMQGAVELYRAHWMAAERALAQARSLLAGEVASDLEEVARLDHNFGVVALYRGRTREAIAAFERSLAAKRRMGDRGGIWTCLLNLALAWGRTSEIDRGRAALDEAVLLTRSLGQTAGTGWCLVARAELEVRARDARAAERWIAEATATLDPESPALATDLALTRAEVALLDHDPGRALEALRTLDAHGDAREEDALCDARALVLEARARLEMLPVDRRAAARLLVRAIRRARAAELVEPEEQASALLREVRGGARQAVPGATPPESSYDAAVPDRASSDLTSDHAAWRVVEELARGATLDLAALQLCRLVVAASSAERAFVVLVADQSAAGGDRTGTDGRPPERAWGADMDGLAIAESAQRVPADLVAQALERSAPVYLPKVDTSGGCGSQLAVSDSEATAPLRAVVVAEHRFAPARFDQVSEASARQWATVAQLLARIASSAVGAASSASTTPRPVIAERSGTPPSLGSLEPTTALPFARPRRVFDSIVGTSAALGMALARLEAAVDSPLPLLLLGETGVGKELFARAVHDHGPRAQRPFVAVSCAAIPDTLFEAELFGHSKGSFTGADRSRLGLLARAEGGTLLLDEIGELPLTRQATLLRALESRTYRPVGADGERPFDVRIVAATNRDLGEAVLRGEFRRDLMYRLNVLEVRIPALREREQDVIALVRHFLSPEHGATANIEISSEALAALARYTWPGNVRELQHCVQRLVAAGLRRVELKHLPREVRAASARQKPAAASAVQEERARPARAPKPTGVDAERQQVARALEAAHGNITHAALALGLTRHGLKKKMLRLGMRVSQASGVRTSPARATPSRAKS